jgi:hypothetical protein
MEPKAFKKIEKATVKLTKKGGQGILVNNHYILTAAHCIDYTLNGAMAMGEYFLEELKTHAGIITSAPVFVDPCSDIALLSEPDGQELITQWEQYDEFCMNTSPIKISKMKLEVGKKYNIFIFCHEKRWITGSAQIFNPHSHFINVKANEQIKGGTSGSAIVDEMGEIIGVVSHFIETSGPCEGAAPYIPLCLSVWAKRLIM